MDIKQLRYFLAIANEGQITAAARKLHMEQPPLSHQLKLLEEELQVKLVERGPRRAELTEAGELLKKKAEQILELADSAKRQVRDCGRGMRGTLSIGTISSSAALIPNEKMQEFHRRYPDIRFEITEGNTFKIIELLRKGLIEIGVVRTPFNSQGFNCRYAPLEPMVAAMTPDGMIGRDAREISVSELKEQPLIIYRRFEQLIYETCGQEGFEPSICCKNDDARTTLLWVQAGFGAGIVPRSAGYIWGLDGVVFKEIQCDALCTRLAAVWMKDRYLSTMGSKFIESFGEI